MSNNIVKQSQLKEIIDYSWTKTKERYDNAFVDAEIPTAEKKIKFTKAGGGATKDVSLEAYARLQDKNDFEKDVTSNIGMTDNTLKYGRLNGNENPNRTSGHRNVTTKAFVDGYIDHIVALADATQEVDESSRWNIWCVTKGETRNDDRVFKKIDVTATIRNQVINGVQEKVVDLPIKTAFTNETYFLVRCENKRYKVVDIKAENQTDDVVNISEVLGGQNSQIPWRTNVTNNISVMFLVGRESIKSLSEKLDKVNSDSSTYVKHTDCINGTEQGEKAGKVVKLGTDGKLHSSLMPAIAINEFISVSAAAWEEGALNGKEYQNGDVIFHEATQKRYLCVDRTKDFNNGRFVELNSKDGIITSINGYRPEANGNIVVTATQNGTGITTTFGSTGGTPVTVATYMTDQEVNEIKALFR